MRFTASMNAEQIGKIVKYYEVVGDIVASASSNYAGSMGAETRRMANASILTTSYSHGRNSLQFGSNWHGMRPNVTYDDKQGWLMKRNGSNARMMKFKYVGYSRGPINTVELTSSPLNMWENDADYSKKGWGPWGPGRSRGTKRPGLHLMQRIGGRLAEVPMKAVEKTNAWLAGKVRSVQIEGAVK